MDKAHIEHRRQTPRLEVVSLVQGASDDSHSVRVVNISHGGALVYSSAPMQVDEFHEFRFVTDSEVPDALCFQARVAHVGSPEAESPNGYYVGLQFIETGTARQTLAVRRMIDICTAPHRQVPLFPETN
jgi:hypothetical protein